MPFPSSSAFRAVLVLAAAVLSGPVGQAVAAEGPLIPPGIYAMFQADDPNDARLAAVVKKTCQRSPAVVYSDGMLFGHKGNSLDEIKAGADYYRILGTLACERVAGNEARCKAEDGLPGSGKGLKLRRMTITVNDGGSVTLTSLEGDKSRQLLPCDMAMFDIAGPDGRNVFDELVRRPDNGPVLARP